jgi:hypothetical protein
MIDKYLEINSIDPVFWGKSGWIFLNSIAITYKPDNRDKYKIFIEQLQYILPCKTCGENLKKNLPTLNNALDSKESFLLWLLKVRNGVYKDNGETSKIKNLKENFDEIFYKRENDYTIIWIIVLVLITILLIYFLKKEIKNINTD